MLNSNTLNWDQVKADFGDANTAMNTAIGGFSKAGDVFTKMRDRIAAEEQQALENEQWQKTYDEQIRQYEKDFAYQEGRDKILDNQWQQNFDEGIRQFDVTSKETHRHNISTEQADLQRAQASMLSAQAAMQNAKTEKDYKEAMAKVQEAQLKINKAQQEAQDTYWKGIIANGETNATANLREASARAGKAEAETTGIKLANTETQQNLENQRISEEAGKFAQQIMLNAPNAASEADKANIEVSTAKGYLNILNNMSDQEWNDSPLKIQYGSRQNAREAMYKRLNDATYLKNTYDQLNKAGITDAGIINIGERIFAEKGGNPNDFGRYIPKLVTEGFKFDQRLTELGLEEDQKNKAANRAFLPELDNFITSKVASDDRERFKDFVSQLARNKEISLQAALEQAKYLLNENGEIAIDQNELNSIALGNEDVKIPELKKDSLNNNNKEIQGRAGYESAVEKRAEQLNLKTARSGGFLSKKERLDNLERAKQDQLNALSEISIKDITYTLEDMLTEPTEENFKNLGIPLKYLKGIRRGGITAIAGTRLINKDMYDIEKASPTFYRHLLKIHQLRLTEERAKQISVGEPSYF